MSGEKERNLYFGADISTQQVKIVVIDDQLNTVYEDAVKYDTDLPEFGTTGGVHMGEDKLTVTSPTLMWVKALDIVLDRMQINNIKFDKIVAVSGAGQQHGSVFWAKGAQEILRNLQPERTMYDQLREPKMCFSIGESPIWMDSSTTKQCKSLEEAVGGPVNLAKITGSKAYERFTGNQIAKLHQEIGDLSRTTERISLVSSFGASLFIGEYAAIDVADGSGMNLMDISSKTWSKKCLDACAPDLAHLLNEPVTSNKIVGNISMYMVERYGFSPNCKVVAFTGDNPASLAGMRLQTNEVTVSLGTSDTLFVSLKEAYPATEGHIFVNPVDTSAYMALLCYKNGSLTREKVRNLNADGKWSTFENLLKSSPKGNNGNIGMFYDIAEITPINAVGYYRFNKENKPVQKFTPEEEVRAVIEGQFVAKRVHAENIGYSIGEGQRIFATGGASANQGILQVLADVFNSSVYVLDIPNSASLGSAYRAKHGIATGVSFFEATNEAPDSTCAANPDPDAREIYDTMTKRFKKLESEYIRK